MLLILTVFSILLTAGNVLLKNVLFEQLLYSNSETRSNKESLGVTRDDFPVFLYLQSLFFYFFPSQHV